MQKNSKMVVWVLSALLMVGSLAGGLVIAQSGRATSASSAAITKESPEIVGSLVQSGGFAPIVKKTGPSVVSIASTMVRKASGNGDDLSQLFPNFPGFNFDNPQFQQRSRKQQAAGSGVIVTSDGYILTNSHMVDGATQVRVKLTDKREFDAKVVGADPKSDLAVLKVNATGLPAVIIGDSSKAEVGDLVLAIGNPFDLGQTVTMGIVSALGRKGLGIEDYENFIQTDAAVNPGNSGGALVNTRGELIGINTAILSETGGNQGIGFAIPSNMARSIMNEIKDHGQVTRGYLGVFLQDLDDPKLASNFGAKDSKGALVADVEKNSPADNAGIERGDIIREINGSPIDDRDTLKLKVGEAAPGSTLSVKVLRNGSEKTLSVKVGTLENKTAAIVESPLDTNSSSKLGVSIQDLTPQVARQLNLGPTSSGVVVVQVQPNSPAAEAGIQQGDIIEEVNRKPVKSTSDFRNALGQSSKSVLLLIQRDGKTSYRVVDREG